MNALFKSLKCVNKTNHFRKVKSGRFRRKKGIMYIIRLYKSGSLGNAQPCLHCQMWLSNYNVRTIKYTDIKNGEPVLCELRLI
jgi:hypothetical protein